MPKVGDKDYTYDAEGQAAAKEESAKTGKPVIQTYDAGGRVQRIPGYTSDTASPQYMSGYAEGGEVPVVEETEDSNIVSDVKKIAKFVKDKWKETEPVREKIKTTVKEEVQRKRKKKITKLKDSAKTKTDKAKKVQTKSDDYKKDNPEYFNEDGSMKTRKEIKTIKDSEATEAARAKEASLYSKFLGEQAFKRLEEEEKNHAKWVEELKKTDENEETKTETKTKTKTETKTKKKKDDKKNRSGFTYFPPIGKKSKDKKKSKDDIKKEVKATGKVITKQVKKRAKKDVNKAMDYVKIPKNVDIKKTVASGTIRGKGKQTTSVTLTGGGAYPTYKKESKPAKSFKTAFAAARKAGKKTFSWDGREYTTKVK